MLTPFEIYQNEMLRMTVNEIKYRKTAMRPKPPKIVTDWQDVIQRPPRCCHTCWHYTESGECKVFEMKPPAEFTQEVDQCQSWEYHVPF
jgi:hypothetical protein